MWWNKKKKKWWVVQDYGYGYDDEGE